jgi:hypothetical protein
MKIALIYLYDKEDETPIVIADPPDNIEDILMDWRLLDNSFRFGVEPPGWMPISSYLLHRGVQVVEPVLMNMLNY